MDIRSLSMYSPSFGVTCSGFINDEIDRARVVSLHAMNESVAKDIYTIRNIYPDKFIYLKKASQTQNYANMRLFMTANKDDKSASTKISDFKWYFGEANSVLNIHKIADALRAYKRKE